MMIALIALAVVMLIWALVTWDEPAEQPPAERQRHVYRLASSVAGPCGGLVPAGAPYWFPKRARGARFEAPAAAAH